MKKFLFIVVLITSSFSLVKAQDNKQDDKQESTEKIQALKIAFITQKIELTPDEAQKFWPVYNRYETEIRQAYKDSRNGGDAIDNEEKILNVKKKYKIEFIKVIGQPKTNILFNSEKEFRGVLMRHLKDKPSHGQ